MAALNQTTNVTNDGPADDRQKSRLAPLGLNFPDYYHPFWQKWKQRPKRFWNSKKTSAAEETMT